MLIGNKVQLRAVEPSDAEIMFGWENDVSLWPVSETLLPFSKETILRFATSPPELFNDRQARFMIEAINTKQTVGCIDLFDFEPFHLRAGIGILIDKSARNNGYAQEALELISRYGFEILCLRQLYCGITEGNLASIKLFTNAGFTATGIKKAWIRTPKGFLNEHQFQLLNPGWKAQS